MHGSRFRLRLLSIEQCLGGLLFGLDTFKRAFADVALSKELLLALQFARQDLQAAQGGCYLRLHCSLLLPCQAVIDFQQQLPPADMITSLDQYLLDQPAYLGCHAGLRHRFDLAIVDRILRCRRALYRCQSRWLSYGRAACQQDGQTEKAAKNLLTNDLQIYNLYYWISLC